MFSQSRFFGSAVVLTAALLLCAGLVACSEDTDATVTYDGVTYALGDTTATVSGHGDKLPAEITILDKVTVDGKDYQVTAIGETAFYECTALTAVTLPDSVTSIGDSAFCGCTALAALNLGKITSIDANAFSETALTAADLSSATSIGGGAFSKCTALTAVTIPDSVTKIANGTFIQCTALTAADTGNGVTSVGERAFYGCTALTSLKLGEKITSLGFEAFHGCTALTEVTIPAGVTDYSASFDSCTALKTFTVAEGNTAFTVADGVLYSKDMGTLYQCPAGLMTVNIPDSVTTIANGAFEGCLLTAVALPNSLTTIVNNAFYGCQLTAVTVPDSVTSIGRSAFNKCTALTAVYLGSGLTDLDKDAFAVGFYAADGTALTDTAAIAGHCYQLNEQGFGLYDGSLIAVTAAAEGGTVTGGGLCAAGTETTVTATAADGYSFAGWYDGETKVSDDAAYTFSPTGSATYSAHFSEDAQPPDDYVKPWMVFVAVVVLIVLIIIDFALILTGRLKL